MKKIFFYFIIFTLISSYSFSQNPQWIVYNTSNSGIPTNNLFSIEIDSNNIKWIGCVNGLIRFDGSNWLYYNNSNSPIIYTVKNVIKDKYNSLWLTCNTQGIIRFKNGIFTVYNSTNSGLPFNNIYGFAMESDTVKWLGTNPPSLTRYDGITWKVLDTNNSGYHFDTALDIKISGHTKWFGSGFHGLGKYNDTTFTYYDPFNSGLPSSTVWCISIVDPTLLWLGTRYGGAARFNITTNDWTVYNTSNSPLPNNTVKDIFANKLDGSVYFAPEFSGLAKLNGTTWTIFNDIVPSTAQVEGFKLDKFNNLWIPSSEGLFVYNPNGVVDIYDQSITINDFKLNQNFPNPFNPSTKIIYSLNKTANIILNIYDINGRQLKVLDKGLKKMGTYEVNFTSEGLASGIYFYRFEAGNLIETKRMVLVK